MNESMNIIVIDDEEGMREGIRRILTKRQFKVDVACDGESAIGLLEKNPYDIAFVDLKMPGIDGFKVTEYINSKVKNHTVVVIVSALATVEAAVEVTRHGAFDFLVKPFTPTDLMEVTDRAVRQRMLISERERYLSELHSERTLSRQLINAMQGGLVVLNIKKKPVLMNPKAEYLLGKKFDVHVRIEELFCEQKLLDAIAEALSADPGAITTKILELQHNDLMLQYRISPLVLDDEINGVIIIIYDFTEEWKVEQDKNRFISMVTHELKSPIAAIINYINVIQTGMFDTQPEKTHEILDRCRIRGEALLDLIRDLLYINKREAGKIEKSVERLDLYEVLASQMEFYKVQSDDRHITVTLAGEGVPFYVRADRSDLDRIFMNLISNGVKYNREGGKLDVEIASSSGEITVTVSDTGIGITPEDQKNLFQEFYRVRNKNTSGISGTGLGLATVKRVLSEYNGRINVESEPEKGSTFTVYLPAAEA
jgi:signal transduction histidine kinase/DNA-binding response OmpR family regulator